MTAPLPPFNVVFFHLPKTGGLTLSHAFRNAWPNATWSPNIAPAGGAYERFVREERDTFPLVADGNRHAVAQWNEQSERHTGVRIFMGHFWRGIDQQLPRPSRCVTIVREPLERVLSMYAHRVQTQGLTVPLERYLATERDSEISNGQTRHLAVSGLGAHVGDVTEAMYDDAVEYLLDEFAAVGTTERYDETFLAIANAISWRSPTYVRANDSANRPRRRELSPALLERLAERNQFDARLHAFVSDQLDKALVGVDVPAELERLRRRNRLEPYRIKAQRLPQKIRRTARRVLR